MFLSPEPTDSVYGYVYGSEYDYSKTSGHKLLNEDVPCAVCLTNAGMNILTIPARNKCYNGWRELYKGLLVGTFHTSKASVDFLCMDNDPEFLLCGSANQDGHVFHLQKTACGSLKCPPYENDKVLSCVVCVK